MVLQRVIKNTRHLSYLILTVFFVIQSCDNKGTNEKPSSVTQAEDVKVKYLSDIIPMIGECNILLGNGKSSNNQSIIRIKIFSIRRMMVARIE